MSQTNYIIVSCNKITPTPEGNSQKTQNKVSHLTYDLSLLNHSPTHYKDQESKRWVSSTKDDVIACIPQ